MKKTALLLLGAAMTLFTGCSSNSGASGENDTNSDSNAVIETIMARRSIRQYKDQPVEREKLEKIVECGINAPSGMNKQPWQVRVVDDPEYINGITKVFVEADSTRKDDPGFKNMFRNAPAVIFIASPRDGSGQLDCGLLGENMLLAAQSLGLGTCCLGGPVRFMVADEKAKPYVDRLELPEDYQLLYAIAVGYPDEEPEAKPRDASKVKFIN